MSFQPLIHDKSKSTGNIWNIKRRVHIHVYVSGGNLWKTKKSLKAAD